tara:strand:- start:254 stop:769 length:516 start_codon:yes stop_codon:yes gene_type:complete
MLLIEYVRNYITFSLPVYALYIFRDARVKMLFFVVGYLFSVIVTILLKLFFQSPTPTVDPLYFNILIKNRDYFEKLVSYEMFGMPSGNAMLASFSVVYISTAIQRLDYICLCTFLFVVVNDVIFQCHFPEQVAVGCLIGIIIGYLSYLTCGRFIRGVQKEKQEDYAMTTLN